MKKIITLVLTFFFGERIQGEPLTPPTFTSTFPEERPSEGEWNKLVSFGNRYGHRGSFYQYR